MLCLRTPFDDLFVLREPSDTPYVQLVSPRLVERGETDSLSSIQGGEALSRRGA